MVASGISGQEAYALMDDNQHTDSPRIHQVQTILSANYQEIPPCKQVDVAARATLLSMQEPSDDVTVETFQLKSVDCMLDENCYQLTDRHDLKACVANTTSKPQSVSAGTCLGQSITVTLAKHGRFSTD